MDETGKITHYIIQGVNDKTFGTYADAEAYVMANFADSVTYKFDLKVKDYAIQTGGFVAEAGVFAITEYVPALLSEVSE